MHKSNRRIQTHCIFKQSLALNVYIYDSVQNKTASHGNDNEVKWNVNLPPRIYWIRKIDTIQNHTVGLQHNYKSNRIGFGIKCKYHFFLIFKSFSENQKTSKLNFIWSLFAWIFQPNYMEIHLNFICAQCNVLSPSGNKSNSFEKTNNTRVEVV